MLHFQIEIVYTKKTENTTRILNYLFNKTSFSVHNELFSHSNLVHGLNHVVLLVFGNFSISLEVSDFYFNFAKVYYKQTPVITITWNTHRQAG